MTPPLLVPDPDRLEALAEFAAGAGHEINNPLATIIGRAQQLAREESDPQRRQSLALIVAQAYRIRDMIGDVMAFSRPPQPEIAPFDLAELIRGVARKHRSDTDEPCCPIEFELPDGFVIQGDAAQWSIVLTELVQNARQAIDGDSGRISMRLREQPDDRFLLVCHNTGRTWTEQEQLHAFDPFFSGRQSGRGLGFGLCRVWQIIRQHHGEIRIDAGSPGGTAVEIVAPRCPSNLPAASF